MDHVRLRKVGKLRLRSRTATCSSSVRAGPRCVEPVRHGCTELDDSELQMGAGFVPECELRSPSATYSPRPSSSMHPFEQRSTARLALLCCLTQRTVVLVADRAGGGGPHGVLVVSGANIRVAGDRKCADELGWCICI